MPCKLYPLLPSQGLELRSLCSHSTCVASIQHCMFPSFFFFFPPPSSPLNLLSLSGMKEKNKIVIIIKKKSPPPTKRTKTWGASKGERPLPLKFRNKKMTCSFELAVP